MNLWGPALNLVAKIEELPPALHPSPSRLPTYYLTDILLIVGGAVLIMIGLIVWVVFIRGPKQPGGSRRIYKYSNPAVQFADPNSRHNRKRKRRKKRRREHRGRNPTLSQAGGLPSPRGDDGGSPFPNPGPTS